MSDKKKEVLDLLYLLNKLNFLTPYKKNLFISVLVGVFIGYVIYNFFVPSKVDIEYTIEDLKNNTSNQIFISTIQQVSSKNIDNGKIKLVRDSNGKIYRFIITGFGIDEDIARKQALKISASIFNKSANDVLIGNINFLNLEQKKAILTNDEAVYLLETELRKLQSTQQALELLKSRTLLDNISHNDSVQFQQDYPSKGNISSNVGFVEIINSHLAETIIQIGLQQQKIAQQNNVSTTGPLKLELFDLIKKKSQDTFTSRETLERETLNLINENLKLMDKVNHTFDELVVLKISIAYNKFQFNSMEDGGQILNSTKKYSMLFCILAGIIFSSIFTVFAIVFRINHMRKNFIAHTH
jgi:hypothetical protein